MKKLLLLHGALGAAANFDKLMPSLQDKYECISIDLPGHGKNKKESIFCIENFTEYLLQYVKENFTEPVHVFGYSMGGYISLNAIVKMPEVFDKVMTLATKFNWTPEEGSNQMKMLNAEKIQEKLPHYAAYLAELHPAHDWKQIMLNTKDLIEKLSLNPPLNQENLQSIENKVCLSVGDKDNMVSIEETIEKYRACKNASLAVLPNTLHPIEKVDVDLLSFLIKSYF